MPVGSTRTVSEQMVRDELPAVHARSECMAQGRAGVTPTIGYHTPDIEGAEFRVLDNTKDLTWLSNVNLLAAEIHDWLGSRDSIITHVSRSFEHLQCGEYDVFISSALVKFKEKWVST